MLFFWYFWQHSIKIFIGLFVLNFTIVATFFLLQLEMQNKKKQPYTDKKKLHYFLMNIFIASFLFLLEICSLLFAHPWIFSPTLLEWKGEIQNDTD